MSLTLSLNAHVLWLLHLPRKLAGWLVCCLVLALVAMQTLGAMHAVVHSLGHGVEHTYDVAHGADHGHMHSASSMGHHHSALLDLFTGHGNAEGCQLFDQVSHGDGLTQAVVPLLAAPAPVFLFQYFQGEAVARWATLFDARGPPYLR